MKMIDFPEISFPIQGLEEVTLPRMVRVRQHYSHDRIEDIPAHLRDEFASGDYEGLVHGKRIAVTVGSRGIPITPRSCAPSVDSSGTGARLPLSFRPWAATAAARSRATWRS